MVHVLLAQKSVGTFEYLARKTSVFLTHTPR